MVGENQGLAASVKIETLAKLLHRHHRALDVPARASTPDPAVPRGLAGFGGLPEREIAGTVFLVFVNIDARAVFHSGKIFFRKLAVLGKFRNAEVIRTIIRAISK